MNGWALLNISVLDIEVAILNSMIESIESIELRDKEGCEG